MREPSVVIIIPNYNGASIKYHGVSVLDVCIKSVEKTEYKNYKIIIADDCSTDNSIAYLKNKFKKIPIVESKYNGGFSKNSNNGIRYAMKMYKPDYVLLLNNDIEIKNKRWLKSLVGIAENDKKVGLVGCKLLFPNGRVQFAGYDVRPIPRYVGRFEEDSKKYDGIREVDGITGALMLIKKECLEKVGLLDENFYMGFDDADYSIRVRENGFKCICNGDISATHVEGFSTTTQNKDKRFFLVQMGFVYFGLKHLDFVDRIKVLLFELGGSVFSIEKEDKRRTAFNTHLRDRILWRLGTSINAIFVAHSIYNKKIKIEKFLT
jgi:GT2 family glycosyltransferase